MILGRDSNYQVILKKVELDLVPEPVCEQKLKKTRLGVFFTLDKSFTCAGGKPNKDTCEGKNLSTVLLVSKVNDLHF